MNWDEITAKVTEVVGALEPLIEGAVALLAPELSAAIAIGEKIVHGVINAEPTAVALYEQIKNGIPPTAEQLKKFSDDYEASYLRLKATIAEQLAALPE